MARFCMSLNSSTTCCCVSRHFVENVIVNEYVYALIKPIEGGFLFIPCAVDDP